MPETDDAGPLFGKLASELQEGLSVNNGVAAGTLHYVTGYTQFSSKVAEQSGNYIALKVVNVPEDAVVTYKKAGSSARPVTLDADRNIVVICTNQPDAVLEFTVTQGADTVVRTVSLANITFEAPAEQAA